MTSGMQVVLLPRRWGLKRACVSPSGPLGCGIAAALDIFAAGAHQSLESLGIPALHALLQNPDYDPLTAGEA